MDEESVLVSKIYVTYTRLTFNREKEFVQVYL